MAWFPGPTEDTERLFHWLHRLNWGLETSQRRVYEHKEEPSGVRFVLSIDSQSVTVLEGWNWRPFSGVGQAVFSLLGAKQEGKSKKRRPRGSDMGSTISFIQATQQHSITASRVFSRTTAVKRIDTTLIQEPWVCDGGVMGLNIPGYTLF